MSQYLGHSKKLHNTRGRNSWKWFHKGKSAYILLRGKQVVRLKSKGAVGEIYLGREGEKGDSWEQMVKGELWGHRGGAWEPGGRSLSSPIAACAHKARHFLQRRELSPWNRTPARNVTTMAFWRGHGWWQTFRPGAKEDIQGRWGSSEHLIPSSLGAHILHSNEDREEKQTEGSFQLQNKPRAKWLFDTVGCWWK